MRSSTFTVGLLTILATLLIVAPGCRRDASSKKFKGPFEGTAESINVETNEVSMKMIHPKHGITMKVNGYINDKTQVEVNGVAARIEDIRPGDPVKVTGYNESTGDAGRFIVTRISVRRPDNGWVKVGDAAGAASAPASGPVD